jgi:hypothetical protein
MQEADIQLPEHPPFVTTVFPQMHAMITLLRERLQFMAAPQEAAAGARRRKAWRIITAPKMIA